MANLPNPVTRKEQYLSAMAENTAQYPEEPITREEMYLDYLCKNGMGGGSGGTTNYNDLTNKPTINGVEVSGNKTSADYKISADVTAIDHGTADTTFTLPPNQYHTWGEVAALTLTLAAEESGVVNEYHFAFDSGATATTLSLPESVQTDIVVEPNTHYECSIIDNYMTFRDWPVEVSA